MQESCHRAAERGIAMFRSGLLSLTAAGVLLALWVAAVSLAAPKEKEKGKDKAKDKEKDKPKEKNKVKPRIIEEIKGKDKKDRARDHDAPKRHKLEYCSLSLKSDSGAKTKKF